MQQSMKGGTNLQNRIYFFHILGVHVMLKVVKPPVKIM